MFRRATIIVILLSAVQLLVAQTRSPYSRFGLGDVNSCPNMRNAGMGGVGYALPYLNDLNFATPAATADIDSMTFLFDFGIGGNVTAFTAENPQKVGQNKSDVQISHVLVGFPITRWWKTAVGFLPYSDVGYSIAAGDSSLNVGKTLRFVGDGGISRISWNNAFRITHGLNIGVGASYLYGKIKRTNIVTFDDDDFLNTIAQNVYRISDFTFNVGVQYYTQIREKHNIYIGAMYDYNKDLKAYRNSLICNALSSGDGNVIDTVVGPIADTSGIGLPHTVGVGLGYGFKNRFFVEVDYTLQIMAGARFFDQRDSLDNSHYLSLGMEYIPAGRHQPFHKYRQGIAYRFGLYSNVTNFISDEKKLQKNIKIGDFGMTFGVGLPMKRSKTFFNIFAKIGQRGTTADGLVRERYFKMGFSVSLAERWFMKNKID